jgi:hypothetical protein
MIMLKEVHNVTFKLCSFISITVAYLTVLQRGCSTVVSIVTRLLTGQSRVQIPAGQEMYLFPKTNTVSGTCLASY